MIRGRDLVVFSDDWGRHPSSCQHLFRRIAPGNRVLWVNTIGTRLPRFDRADAARVLEKMQSWVRPPDRPAPLSNSPSSHDTRSVEVVSPFMLPADRWSWGRKANRAILAARLRRELRDRAFRSVILVTTLPNASHVAGRLEESIAVYYCVDDFSEWPGEDRRTLLDMERKLLGKVDLVLATSEKLFEDKSALHNRVRLLRHGVDVDHFSGGAGVAPAALKALPRPRVGVTGLVDERLDVGLLAQVAGSRPEISFVFVGPRQLPAGQLDALPNVTFLSAVPFDDVPAVLREFDVAIVPYVESRLTERINPLKLREYLASGIPVVTSPLPEAVRYADVLEVARSTEDWGKALQRALSEGRSRASVRAARVKSETWEARAEEFARHVLETEESIRPVR